MRVDTEIAGRIEGRRLMFCALGSFGPRLLKPIGVICLSLSGEGLFGDAAGDRRRIRAAIDPIMDETHQGGDPFGSATACRVAGTRRNRRLFNPPLGPARHPTRSNHVIRRPVPKGGRTSTKAEGVDRPQADERRTDAKTRVFLPPGGPPFRGPYDNL